MLNVNSNGVIQLTRGDSAWFSITVNNAITGEEYTTDSLDTLTLTIKKRAKDEEALVEKTIDGTGIFYIEPSDTSDLKFGSYVYDVQLTTADGHVFTVITPTTFEILSEVTY